MVKWCASHQSRQIQIYSAINRQTLTPVLPRTNLDAHLQRAPPARYVVTGDQAAWWDPILKSCGLGGPILKSLKSVPRQLLSLSERSILKSLKSCPSAWKALQGIGGYEHSLPRRLARRGATGR